MLVLRHSCLRLSAVEDGQVGSLVEKDDVFLLLRVDGRQAGGLRQFDEVKVDIYSHLMDQKTDLRLKEWTRGLKSRAFIDIRL